MPKREVEIEEEVTQTITEEFLACDSCGMEGEVGEFSPWSNQNYDNDLYFCDGCLDDKDEIYIASGSTTRNIGNSAFGSWRIVSISLAISALITFSFAGLNSLGGLSGAIFGALMYGITLGFIFILVIGTINGLAANDNI